MANEYRIMTDSSCDLPEEFVREYELRVLPLRVTLGEETYFNEPGAVDSHTFYEKLRAGVPAKTSAVNTQAFLDAMKEELDAGRDVLYIGFSSGLSGTYSAGEMAAQSLRPQIGSVQQDVYLFNASIYENILYGKPTATKEEVIQASKRANIHEFVCSLEHGYDTVIGERGVNLSG